MSIRYFFAGAFCLLVAGCSAGDARMSALRADMAGRQAAAELAASRPDAKPEDRERARAYASAQSCVDQIQAHSRSVQAANMAANTAMAAVSLAGPGGALAARAMGPMQGMALRSQGEFRVACY
ncbi:hypothetical protein [Pseudaminobacter soli (ex Li et al. 2025)]|uniref:Uncharacterized protein n=1 Tax=Pseudaminobacter soli (ex Li et al. 2025) TaxID=1295366 RepID=A0A2P7S513_9HYPH|nr:hypothetical protein [Mesorhizobium soli]PSJ57575.1 hypothetical protein C7I85_21615 [Mesorhizobium soli]